MGHFDILADSAFRKMADGRVIFVAGGKFGRGYEVPTKEKYDEIRTFMKNFMIACVVLGGVAALVGVLLTVFLIVPGMYVAYRVRVRSLTRGLTEVEQTDPWIQRMKEHHRRQAAISNFARFWLFLIISVLFLVMGIAMLLSDAEAKGYLQMVPIFVIVLFGFCAVGAGYMIWVKHGLAGKPDPLGLW